MGRSLRIDVQVPSYGYASRMGTLLLPVLKLDLDLVTRTTVILGLIKLLELLQVSDVLLSLPLDPDAPNPV